MKCFIPFLCCLVISSSVYGQKRTFFPKKNYWHVQTLVPIEPQSYGFVAAYWHNSTPADFMLAAFGFGFQRAFLRWQKSESRGCDLGVEGAALSQFEFTHRTGVLQRNLLSTDYRIGIPFVIYFKPWTLRFRLSHLSAHMGDDYIFRHHITTYQNNNNNYDQFDVTALYTIENYMFYLGIGTILFSPQHRKPLSFNAGFNYTTALNLKKTTSFFAGFNVDGKQDKAYVPAVNVGTGLQLGNDNRWPFKILATYFVGPLPYSVYEGERVQWLGLGIYLNPF